MAIDYSGIPPVPTNVPTSARAYGWMLGGTDHFAVDRQFLLNVLPTFPECVDIARQNRQFLYRAVRYLARDAGIRQFVDMGCGLPTDNNVHQVAKTFAPDARVVYVDVDPIVLAHGEALLTDRSTAVITADIRDQDAVLDHPDFRRLIDFSQPMAVLFFGVPHYIADADDPRRVLRTIVDRTISGSFLAVSHVVADDPGTASEMCAHISAAGIPWHTRVPSQVDAFVDGLEPVEPGLVNVENWRPDPSQPPLPRPDQALAGHLGVTKYSRDVYEYGGVLRKP
ncbi:MAG: SAM-dependent methyltransferase [Stackebrandtia sp.]